LHIKGLVFCHEQKRDTEEWQVRSFI